MESTPIQKVAPVPVAKKASIVDMHCGLVLVLFSRNTYFNLYSVIQDNRAEEKLQREKEKLQGQVEALKKAAQVGSKNIRLRLIFSRENATWCFQISAWVLINPKLNSVVIVVRMYKYECKYMLSVSICNSIVSISICTSEFFKYPGTR